MLFLKLNSIYASCKALGSPWKTRSSGHLEYSSIRANITLLLQEGPHKSVWIVSHGFFGVRFDWSCGYLFGCDEAVQD